MSRWMRWIAVVVAVATPAAAQTPVQRAPDAQPVAPVPVAQPEPAWPDNDPSALAYFRPTLDAYGEWIRDPTYGVVWVPDPAYAGAGFAPYVSNGHWALDDDGDWMWVSDYPWGWVVFHYGRWAWISGTGWAWIPGRRYAPAWVVWRVGDPGWNYVGWAPMPPSFIWVDGRSVWLAFQPPYPFVFCASYWAFSPYLHRHVVGAGRVHDVARHSHRWRDEGREHRGPPPARAHVPAVAIPRRRVAADPRAIAASRRSARIEAPRPLSPASRTLPRGAPTPVERTPAAPRALPRTAPAPVPRAPTAPRALPRRGPTPVPRAPATTTTRRAPATTTTRRAPPAPYLTLPRAPVRAAPAKPPARKAPPAKKRR